MVILIKTVLMLSLVFVILSLEFVISSLDFVIFSSEIFILNFYSNVLNMMNSRYQSGIRILKKLSREKKRWFHVKLLGIFLQS